MSRICVIKTSGSIIRKFNRTIPIEMRRSKWLYRREQIVNTFSWQIYVKEPKTEIYLSLKVELSLMISSHWEKTVIYNSLLQASLARKSTFPLPLISLLSFNHTKLIKANWELKKLSSVTILYSILITLEIEKLVEEI